MWRGFRLRRMNEALRYNDDRFRVTRASRVAAELKPAAMTDSKDYPTLADTVGGAPLVRLQRLPGITKNVILAKLEGDNPAGSVKDRPAISMIRHAERRGDIKPGDTLIEPTSGNTGIALAMAAAIRGYKMILIMPEHLSAERRQTMRAFGAEIVLTPRRAAWKARATSPRGWCARARAHARPVRQSGQPARALPHDRPRDLARHRRRITHFVSAWARRARSWACRSS